jgi:hypothetical protein
MKQPTHMSLGEIPPSVEVREEDHFARTGAVEMKALSPLRSGMCQAAMFLLSALGLRHCVGEGLSLKVDSTKEPKG